MLFFDTKVLMIFGLPFSAVAPEANWVAGDESSETVCVLNAHHWGSIMHVSMDLWITLLFPYGNVLNKLYI